MKPNEAEIPPLELRWGVGPFDDPEVFVSSGRDDIAIAARLSCLRPEHSVLEIGCGSGRVALALRGFLGATGSYVGLDPSADYLDWCNDHLAANDARFSFQRMLVLNPAYNPGPSNTDVDASVYELPQLGAFDRVLLISVFTHVLPDGIRNYVRQLARLLKPGGEVIISVLLMNDATERALRTGNKSFDFVYPIDRDNWTHDEACPTQGISSRESWLLDVFREAGFALRCREYGNWRTAKGPVIKQDWLVFGR